MRVTKQKVGTAVFLALGVVVTGMGVFARQPPDDGPPAAAEPKVLPAPEAAPADGPGSIDVELQFAAEGRGSSGSSHPTLPWPELLKARFAARMSELRRAEAQLELAQVNLARLERLYKRGSNFVSVEEMARAKAEVKIAEAEQDLKSAGVREAELVLAEAQRPRDPTPGAVPAPASALPDSLETRLREIERKLDLILDRLGDGDQRPRP